MENIENIGKKGFMGGVKNRNLKTKNKKNMKNMENRGKKISVRGAREHNLKNINCFLPRDKLVVITGLSGSGKSSLAFDTIYAEGQRRYIESLSSYAKQFLKQLKKPEYESIKGLCPSIAIEQKTVSYNPRSTVGTVTEIFDYLRLLFARVGEPFCPNHKESLKGQSLDEIFSDIMKLSQGSKFLVISPVVRGRKGEFFNKAQEWLKKGFLRARVDGVWLELSRMNKLSKQKKHNIDILIDRLVMRPEYSDRLKESLKWATKLSGGFVGIELLEKKIKNYSIKNSCTFCDYVCPDLEPRTFSFNDPKGMCTVCHGLGSCKLKIYDNSYEYEENDEIDELALDLCPTCRGYRLNQSALNVFLQSRHIGELSELSCDRLLKFMKELSFELNDRKKQIAEKIIEQIVVRLEYMVHIGTGYLSLNRPTRTLSGGEGQRIRLTHQLSSSMRGILYVLDEPSIGLHPKDHFKLLKILREIQKKGNTVILVEHDEETIRFADHILDLGPRAGSLGGKLIAEGSLQDIMKNKKSLTGQYLSGKLSIPIPKTRRKAKRFLEVKGASGHNLKNLNVKFPLETFCGITGVSGSGKSTLVRETLYRVLARKFKKSSFKPASYNKISGFKNLDNVIEINQKPIGKTSRSVPSTYIGVFTLIRELFSQLPEAQMRGYKTGHFSFNVSGGRCEKCSGLGEVKLNFRFMRDSYVLCDECSGLRYNSETLSIRFKDQSIADILKMTVKEACDFFSHHKLIYKKLDTLQKVGLSYLTLGQNSATLSGGEAQRIKLGREISKQSKKHTLYILDEPTTGLHFDDVYLLIKLLHSLVDKGHTVLVIEHNLDIIKNCDYIIDMGPEGGVKGGFVLAEGTPEQIVKIKKSITAPFLKPLFKIRASK